MKAPIVALVTFAVVDSLKYNGEKYLPGDGATVEMSEAEAASLLALPVPPIARTTPESERPAGAYTDDNTGTDAGALNGDQANGGTPPGVIPPPAREDNVAKDGAAGDPPSGAGSNSSEGATGANARGAAKSDAAGKDATGRKEKQKASAATNKNKKT